MYTYAGASHRKTGFGAGPEITRKNNRETVRFTTIIETFD